MQSMFIYYVSFVSLAFFSYGGISLNDSSSYFFTENYFICLCINVYI